METSPKSAEVDAGERPPEMLPGLTRERLKDGTMLAAYRAAAPVGMVVKSDAELAASLAETLKAHDPATDIWIFAYGSLMWNPALNFVESTRADLRGWCRRFCIRLTMG